MKSHPTPTDVVAELGDKAIDAFRYGVAHAKGELDVYRKAHPDWLAGNAKRTVANLIHDWMWSAVSGTLIEDPNVTVIDSDPKRELFVKVESEHRLAYRMRLKRHHLDGSTSSYQTQTVIDFDLQGVNQTFPGYDEVRLQVGYEWDDETRTMGAPLITLRDGRNNIIWTHILPPHIALGGGTVTYPTTPEPVTPVVDVQADDDQRTGSDQP